MTFPIVELFKDSFILLTFISPLLSFSIMQHDKKINDNKVNYRLQTAGFGIFFNIIAISLQIGFLTHGILAIAETLLLVVTIIVTIVIVKYLWKITESDNQNI